MSAAARQPDLLQETHDLVVEIKTKVSSLEKTVLGNGQIGLVGKMEAVGREHAAWQVRLDDLSAGQNEIYTALEAVKSAQDSCPARLVFDNGNRSVRSMVISNWIALAALLIALASLFVHRSGNSSPAPAAQHRPVAEEHAMTDAQQHNPGL